MGGKGPYKGPGSSAYSAQHHAQARFLLLFQGFLISTYFFVFLKRLILLFGYYFIFLKRHGHTT